jgi:hypothetical protein
VQLNVFDVIKWYITRMSVRTPEQYITKKPNVKKEYTRHVKFCKYCKLKKSWDFGVWKT